MKLQDLYFYDKAFPSSEKNTMYVDATDMPFFSAWLHNLNFQCSQKQKLKTDMYIYIYKF